MQITDTTIVLASLDPPSIWDFYGNVFFAAAKQSEANSYDKRLQTHGAWAHHYEIMTYGAYKAAERIFYLKDPPTEITEATFMEMFTVLPPKAYHHVHDLESFCMSEHWSGPYTSQYIRYRDRYYTKLVDYIDRNTWMTAATFTTEED